MMLVLGWSFLGFCFGWLGHEAFDSFERKTLGPQPRHWHNGHPCQNEAFHAHNRRSTDRKRIVL